SSMRDSAAESSASNGSRKLVVTDVILSADTWIGAVRADARVVRPRRELAALNPVDNLHEPLPRIGQYFLIGFTGLDDRSQRPFPTKRDVGGFVDYPVATALSCQPLLRTHRIDGRLQRTFWLRRIPRFVVDHPQLIACHEIDAIGDALERQAPSIIGAE